MYAWELYVPGRPETIKHSVPIFRTEYGAKIAGQQAREVHLANLKSRRPTRLRLFVKDR